ncbi:MAG: ThuA domain-containing protein [Planctomycetaceae bacterium]|nr:ThuA domain-containing protein [Planctomycetaceae bacterium]
MKIRSPFVIGIVCAYLFLPCSQAWLVRADDLPVTEGLLVRLEFAETSEVTDPADRVSAWVSSTGSPLRFSQPNEKFQPKSLQIEGRRIARFDGLDDYLRVDATGMKSASVSLFVVAAPHSNAGDFRGLFAANASGERDYVSGLNIDLGPGPGRALDMINIEGRGFGGARDLMESSLNFGTLHTFEVVIDAETKVVRSLIDGRLEGTRPCDGSELSLDELTLGARYYTNGPGAQQVRAPFEGDIAEVLLYGRALPEAEAQAVRGYLKLKYAAVASALPKTITRDPALGVELVKVEKPPAVQVLVPGFEVDELPLQLTNCNNVRYREDGKLVTLGYNGDIHLLTDTNGDGLEDAAEVFWKNEGSIRGPIGMLLTPPGYKKGRGVFVPSKGKVSLIVDTDGDDKADQEIVVASGWNEIPQNVDALGPAMDRDGNLYFGLGVANFANAYQVGDDGKSQYNIRADNGTIQRVSADFSKRESVCTGIRFPVALAFNHLGDLFCTEQEGATWLANGNPLDELLHIRLNESSDATPNPNGKRHFGFPPRHPDYNPGIVDEPSTFDFGPQHQSTCGMVFNEPVNGGPVFGAEWWQHDAIVCGESRGKIWRTQTVRTPVGYVADSQLIACLQMLTVDACVSPDGSLVIACHSGPPDWGTGPTGTGKLFRVRQVRKKAPRPVRTWAAGLQEIRIAFDHPIAPSSLRGALDQIVVQYGEHVRAGDRFETLVPPYAVVRAQQLKPRFELPVAGVTLTADLKTVILHTSPMNSDVHYSVTLPSVIGLEEQESGSWRDHGQFPQHKQIDVDLALRGVHASWKGIDDEHGPQKSETPSDEGQAGNHTGMIHSGEIVESWTLPHADLNVSLQMLAASAESETLVRAISRPGILTLETQLNLHDMLRPAIQPGASIDYAWPDEIVTVTVTSTQQIVVQATTSGAQPTDLAVRCGTTPDGIYTAVFESPANVKEPIRLTVEMTTAARGDEAPIPGLTMYWHTNEDSSPRPFPLHRYILPWVNPARGRDTDETFFSNSDLAELQGGSWGRGRRVFRSEAAGCFKCHEVGGTALSSIGPDLRNLVHRDYASVIRDIANPSYAINPDYIGHTIELKDGLVLTGVLRTVGNQLLLGDAQGKTTVLTNKEIEAMYPSRVSVMPPDLTKKLSQQELKDLLTYLLTPPPAMPLQSPLNAPPLRTQAEVAAALAGSAGPPGVYRPLKMVLVAGPKDHGPGEHDYPAWQQQWEELLTGAEGVTVDVAWEFPNEEQLASADVVLFFQKGSFGDTRPEKLDAFLKRGGGAVYIHWAVNGNDQVREFSRRIGYASWGGRISYRHGPLTLDIHNTDHPVVRNFEQLQLYDESYWKLTGKPEDVTLLATSTEDGMATPQIWVRDHNPGRVFVSIPGHYSWTFDDPLFRILMLRGIAWSAGEPVDRFNDLVTPGARLLR